jgi:dTDP-4-dehydrorhamnose reductase
VVVRLPLLLGNSLTGQRSVHERLLAEWAAGRTPRLFSDELRQSCTANNVAELALALLASPEICGVHHWAGADLLSRAEQGRKLRGHFKLSSATAPIEEVARAAWPALSARRPANLALEAGSLAKQTRVAQESFKDALAKLQLPSSLAAWHARVRAG